MESVTSPTGKITPASVEEPAAAKPPPAKIEGGPIEAAAQKTEAAIAEAAASNSVLASSSMSGGADVEVKIPGAQMPSGGDGPAFADNYTKAVETLHALKSDGAADSLTSAPAEIVNPTKQGGGSLAFEPEQIVTPDKTAGALIGRHWRTPQSRFHPAELAKGVKMEMEHTDNHRIALEIAKDHLSELPDYYSRLERMEKRAFAERKKKGPKTRKHGRGNKRTHRRRHR
jgi:hypothetical protein